MSQAQSQVLVVQSFQVTIGGKLKTFATEQEALQALAREQFVAEVDAYLDATVEGDNTKLKAGRANVILDFLSYRAAQVQSAN